MSFLVFYSLSIPLALLMAVFHLFHFCSFDFSSRAKLLILQEWEQDNSYKDADDLVVHMDSEDMLDVQAWHELAYEKVVDKWYVGVEDAINEVAEDDLDKAQDIYQELVTMQQGCFVYFPSMINSSQKKMIL